MDANAVKIVTVAKSYVGSGAWMYIKEKDGFGKNKNKCNQFVYDVVVEAGLPGPTVPKYGIFSRPPTAGEWATPAVLIKGWKVVTEPQAGDVVAEAHRYADATGHVGIVVEAGQTASASSNEGGKIVQNDWGFRADNHPTFRRYIG
ncbi:MAG: CHAP domain-containing protein [Pirellulaceae bacterium]